MYIHIHMIYVIYIYDIYIYIYIYIYQGSSRDINQPLQIIALNLMMTSSL